MHRARRNAFLIALVAIALTAAALVCLGPLRVDTRAALAEALPDRIGSYRGIDLRFCQSDQCGRGFSVDEQADLDACPVCGSPMAEAALAERRILPRDTTILRKEYRNDAGGVFTVAAVMAGASRQSIHPPQVCLRAQGFAITSERVYDVPMPRGAPLQVKCLELSASGGGPGGGQYAYWFVARGHETPYHVKRLWWTAWDGVVHGEHRRWAYVAITSDRPNPPGQPPAALLQFIAELYPLLLRPSA